MALSRELEELFPSFHERLSAHWQEGDNLNKVDVSRIIEKMELRYDLLKKGDDKSRHYVRLCMTRPKRKRIEAIAIVHEYHDVREDGFDAWGRELLYFDANTTVGSLKNLRDGLTQVIGDENDLLNRAKQKVRYEVELEVRADIEREASREAQRELERKSQGKTKFKGATFTSEIYRDIHKPIVKYDYTVDDSRIDSYDIYVMYESGVENVIAGNVSHADLESSLKSLTTYAPLRGRDSTGRVRSQYRVYQSGTKTLVRTVD